MPRKREPMMQNRVRELRTSGRRLTQQELADAVQVTRQTIVALEAGSYTPSLALALRVAQVFQQQVEDVFWLAE